MELKKFVLAMVVFVAGALMPLAHAANEVHNITKDTFHNSIQAAITAAAAGDMLVVEASLTMVIGGERVELDTTVEILRKDNNSKSWKR